MAVELKNLVCLITGADEGIGRGLVRGFLGRGARVAAGLLDAAQAASGVLPALALQMDVTQPEQVQSAIAKTLAEFGRIDVLINNAGVYPRRPADVMTYADW